MVRCNQMRLLVTLAPPLVWCLHSNQPDYITI
jgi:hypothetical protein